MWASWARKMCGMWQRAAAASDSSGSNYDLIKGRRAFTPTCSMWHVARQASGMACQDIPYDVCVAYFSGASASAHSCWCCPKCRIDNYAHTHTPAHTPAQSHKTTTTRPHAVFDLKLNPSLASLSALTQRPLFLSPFLSLFNSNLNNSRRLLSSLFCGRLCVSFLRFTWYSRSQSRQSEISHEGSKAARRAASAFSRQLKWDLWKEFY